ncbi:TPA: hypothetical protein ACH3X3_006930 [Trebouxia sp. C0006]
MAHFASESELETFLGRLDPDFEWVEEIDEEQQLALLGLADDEEFVPAFEMDAFDSDVMAESGDSDDE